VPRRKADNQLAMDGRRAARCHYQAAIRRSRECGEGTLDLIRVVNVDRAHVYSD
jgi:hypothetical protein